MLCKELDSQAFAFFTCMIIIIFLGSCVGAFLLCIPVSELFEPSNRDNL